MYNNDYLNIPCIRICNTHTYAYTYAYKNFQCYLNFTNADLYYSYIIFLIVYYIIKRFLYLFIIHESIIEEKTFYDNLKILY